MNTAISVIALGFILLITIMSSVWASDEMRSGIYNLSQKEVIIDGAMFSGFYYDIDDNTGTEKLTLRLSNISSDRATASLSDQPDSNGNRGVVYTVGARPSDFSFDQWGQYEEIRYLGEDYFAGYDKEVTWSMKNAHQSVPFLYDKSEDGNLMANEQISPILIDTDDEQTINYTKPLKLEEGYQLAIKTIDADGKTTHVELYKDGNAIDDKVIKISDENADIGDETYYCRKDLGDTKDIVIIAVHFKDIFGGPSTNAVIIDGIFQISDRPTSLKSATSVNPIDMTITIDNKDRQITLNKNKDIALIENIYIKTADQNIIDAQNPLRYYIYKKNIDPGWYELRGSVANLSVDQFMWTNATFPGFYYDIDNKIGTEQLTFRLSERNPASASLSDQPDARGHRGVVYMSTARAKDFKFKLWGQYKVIGFLGDLYFASYDETLNEDMKNVNERTAYLYDMSTNRNLMTNEQICKVLLDTDTETTVTSDSPLKMEEDYQLAIKSVDVNGRKVQLELSKKGKVVDSKVIGLPDENANIGDGTYYYRRNLGDTKEIVIIAVHFKRIFASSNANIAIIDGIFQISDTPTSLRAGKHYDMMSVSMVDPIAMTIEMDNKGNEITLSQNKYISLMWPVGIHTADQDSISSANPLRYYIYKSVSIKGETATVIKAVTEKAEAKDAEKNVIAEVEETKKNNTTKAVAVEEVQNITAKLKAANENSTPYIAAIQQPDLKRLPGFESTFALTGLLSLAWILLTRERQTKGP